MNPQVKENYKILLKMHFENKQLLSKKEVAEYLNIPVSMMRNYMGGLKCFEQIKFIKLGTDKRSAVRFHIDDFADFLARTQKDIT